MSTLLVELLLATLQPIATAITVNKVNFITNDILVKPRTDIIFDFVEFSDSLRVVKLKFQL